MTDFRKHPRGSTDGYLVVHDNQTGLPMGRLRNLTVEGTMLICTEYIRTPSIMQCRLTLPDVIEGAREFYFELEGKWCQENQRAGWYELGCVFVNLSSKNKTIINHLIENWMTLADSTDATNRA